MVKDLTQGSVTGTLLRFSWPFMLSNLLQIVYNMVDMVVVGRFVGSAGLSAVSCGGNITGLFTGLCMGFTTAGQIMVSQFVGRKDPEGIRRTIGTMFTFDTLLSAIFSAVGLLLLDWLLDMNNVPAQALDQARSYCACCFWGMFFIFGYNAVSSILRGMGDSKRPLIFIGVAAVTNLVLDIVFVGFLGWNAWGAAFATVLSQALSLILSLAYLYRWREGFGFDFKPRSFAVDESLLRTMCRLGVPMALQHSAVMASKLFVSSFINSYGVVISAVNGIGSKIGMCASVVSNALSAAGTSMIGQNFGAGRWDRIRRTVYVSLAFGLAYSAVLSLFIVLFPEQIFGLFDTSQEVLAMSRRYVPIALLSFLGFAIRSPMMALISGMGRSTLSLAIGLLDGIVARVGLAWMLGSVFGMGIMGYWLGDCIASQIPFLIGGVFFWSGMYKKCKVVVDSAREPGQIAQPDSAGG